MFLDKYLTYKQKSVDFGNMWWFLDFFQDFGVL